MHSDNELTKWWIEWQIFIQTIILYIGFHGGESLKFCHYIRDNPRRSLNSPKQGYVVVVVLNDSVEDDAEAKVIEICLIGVHALWKQWQAQCEWTCSLHVKQVLPELVVYTIFTQPMLNIFKENDKFKEMMSFHFFLTFIFWENKNSKIT